MPRFRLVLLGGFDLRRGPNRLLLPLPKKVKGLIAYLAVKPGQPYSRDKLAELLWGERAPDQARHSLRQAVFALRQTLARSAPSDLILVRGGTLAMNPSAADVDVAAFERLVAEGNWTALDHAATLYSGDLLDGLHIDEPVFEDWLLSERERLRELAVEAMARLLQRQERMGVVEAAIQTALRLLKLDRSLEVVHRTLIRLYARQGRRGEALRQYRACVGVLRRDLGLAPEAETERLYREIVQRAPRIYAREA